MFLKFIQHRSFSLLIVVSTVPSVTLEDFAAGSSLFLEMSQIFSTRQLAFTYGALWPCVTIIPDSVRKKLDIKDGILIIAPEREGVKMNVYEWLESPDVQETIGKYNP